MPFVSVRITRDGVTREQKAQVIAEITDTLQRVLGKDPKLTHIVIEEVDTDNWGVCRNDHHRVSKKSAGVISGLDKTAVHVTAFL